MRKPHTDKHADKVNQQQSYVPARFIDVQFANVRLATVSGVFQVSKDNPDSYPYRGNTVIDVYCWWYQWQPQRGCIRLILRNNEKPYDEPKPGVSFYCNIER
jgi:hypothetical protein